MDGLLILIAALLALLVLIGITALVVVVEYARRGMAALRCIQAAVESDSNETLPAIRAALSDVVDVLIPRRGA